MKSRKFPTQGNLEFYERIEFLAGIGLSVYFNVKMTSKSLLKKLWGRIFVIKLLKFFFCPLFMPKSFAGWVWLAR